MKRNLSILWLLIASAIGAHGASISTRIWLYQQMPGQSGDGIVVGQHVASGSVPLPGTAFLMNYTGESWGNYAGSHLYSSSSLSAATSTAGGVKPSQLWLESALAVEDSLTFRGTAGVSGSVTITFDLDIDSWSHGLWAGLGVNLAANEAGIQPVWTMGGTGQLPFTRAAFTFPVVLGTPTSLWWASQVFTGWRDFGGSGPHAGDYAFVDSMHTISLSAISLVDADGNPIPLDIVSESGTLYGANGAQVVPEPNVAWLVAPGLFSVFLLARRRRNAGAEQTKL